MQMRTGVHLVVTDPTMSERPRRKEMPTPMSLLDRARAKDGAAWERLMGLYRPLVLFWIRRGGIDEDAEDVCQEVFAAVAHGLDGFRRDRPGDRFRGWLRVVAYRQVALYFRRNKGRPVAEGGSEALERIQGTPDPLAWEEDEQERQQHNQLTRQAVQMIRGEFEEATWGAFWQTAIEGRAPAALEEELGMSCAAIRQAKSRVLRRLKQELGDVLD
jgi:RNA polymerase sigma-70 factor (ECF subfamily)